MEDRFELHVYFAANPLKNWEEARPFLETLLNAGGDLAPTHIWKNQKQDVPFDLETARGELSRARRPQELYLRRLDVELGFHWIGFSRTNPASQLTLSLPLAFLADADHAQSRADQVVSLAAALCKICPPVYGWAHSRADALLGGDPTLIDAWAAKEVFQAYWLLILGAAMVRKLTRKRVQSVPAYHTEFLSDGVALIQMPLLPGDFASLEAREAQARALGHLKPGSDYNEILAGLLDRSVRLQPIERRWNPDLQHLFETISTFTPLESRRAVEEQFNAYQPSAITERLPARDALPPDVEDVGQSIRAYHRESERFVMGLHDEIKGLIEEEPDALREIDIHFYLRDLSHVEDRAEMERLLVSTLGAYVGNLLERVLDGEWLPRRNLEEAQVVVGEYAWLPYLRVKRFLQSKQAVVDHSLYRFYREAERLASLKKPLS